MKVELIQITQNPIDVMWTAARTCYSQKSPIEMWDEEDRYPKLKGNDAITDEHYNEMQEKMWNLIKKVLDSGHQSVAEHVYFTFAIEGISRACSHQLVRHRHCTFSQQSQRYVEIKEDISLFEDKSYISDNYLEDKELIEILDKYFVWDHNNYSQFHMLMQAMYIYLYQIREGIKPEDARSVLPNCTKTNMTVSVNFRELIHICNLRLCSRAQKEIRDLFKEIVECVRYEDERLASYLVPQCEVFGFCKEDKCCGRKPKLSEIMNTYKITHDEIVSQKDFNQLMEDIKNPKVNENLKKC